MTELHVEGSDAGKRIIDGFFLNAVFATGTASFAAHLAQPSSWVFVCMLILLLLMFGASGSSRATLLQDRVLSTWLIASLLAPFLFNAIASYLTLAFAYLVMVLTRYDRIDWGVSPRTPNTPAKPRKPPTL